MLRFTETSQIPSDFVETVVTIGKFDGIHLGHQQLLHECLELAEAHGLAAVAVTFNQHPNVVLNPERVQLPIIGNEQKLELLAESGMDATLILNFDLKLASLSPDEFVRQVLVEGLKAKAVVVGADFRYGSQGSGDAASLRVAGLENGFTVKVIEPVELDGVKVSSTEIRHLLDQGNVREAAKFLGRIHSTRGVVEHGLKLGRQLGFPTANLSRDAEGYLPLDAVYAGWLHSKGERYPAALSVGINETLQAVPRLVEAHVIGRKDLDLYDQVVTIDYVDFIRPAAKFADMQELIEAIDADLVAISKVLAAQEG